MARKGFDSEQPAAWLAEGLLPYLPGDAVAGLLDTTHSFATPGSTVAVEYVHDAQAMLGDPTVRTMVRIPADHLSTLGWAVGEVSSRDLAERYGRTLDDEFFHSLPTMVGTSLPGFGSLAA